MLPLLRALLSQLMNQEVCHFTVFYLCVQVQRNKCQIFPEPQGSGLISFTILFHPHPHSHALIRFHFCLLIVSEQFISSPSYSNYAKLFTVLELDTLLSTTFIYLPAYLSTFSDKYKFLSVPYQHIMYQYAVE